MKFGSLPLSDVEGAILAHAAKLPDGRIPKGRRLLPEDILRLAEGGMTAVTVATLDGGDMVEDEAASAIAAGLAGPWVEAADASTGRVNLFAGRNGVLVVDRRLVDGLNAVDPGITLATLPEFANVAAGQMVATVKIIPLALSGSAIDAARTILDGGPALRLAPYRPHRVALVQTRLPSVKESVLDKTRDVLEARLGASRSEIVAERRCRHETGALAEELRTLDDADLVVVFGASAVIDGEDVVPSAIRRGGGSVTHLGMPVDPGNLLLLGRFRDASIIGAPGCARSSKENGFDWVLNRLLADIPVTPKDIRGMGVGGLLTEIPSRPQPRQPRGTR